MDSTIWVILAVVAIVVVFVWTLYNSLVTAKVRIQEAWSGIDVQLKRRTDLIPNIVASVKGYAAHEKEVFENVTKARSALLSAQTVGEKGQADTMLSGALKSLFAIAEAYPQLRANENFLQLQNELSDVEAKIAYARQFYNANVMDYNTKIKVFPNMLLASTFGFQEEEFFQADQAERQPVKVQF